MIRINLLGEKEDRSGIHYLQLFVFCASALLLLGLCAKFHLAQVSELEMMEKTKARLEIQVASLREKTKAVDLLEKNKKLLAEKLMTIAKLKAKKQGPVRVLDDLTQVVPERAWLTAIIQKSDNIEFKGVALDNQTVAQFMEKIKASRYFRDADLRVSKQYVRDQVKLQQFHVLARLTSMLEVSSGTTNAVTAEGKNASEEKK